MRLLKGIRHNVMLKLTCLELIVLIVSDRFIVFPLKFGTIPKHPCEFAVVPWGPLAHSLGIIVQACSLPSLFLLLNLMVLLGHIHFKKLWTQPCPLVFSFLCLNSWSKFKLTLSSPFLASYTNLVSHCFIINLSPKNGLQFSFYLKAFACKILALRPLGFQVRTTAWLLTILLYHKLVWVPGSGEEGVAMLHVPRMHLNPTTTPWG